MKTTQAWGWLAAGVLALGLNGFYQDGGAAWVHRALDQVSARIIEHSGPVLALVSGHVEWFAAKSRATVARDETSSCRAAVAVARFQTRMARTHAGFSRFEAMSVREEAQLARLESRRAQLEAKLARVSVIPADFAPVNLAPACPRVRVEVPRVHVEAPVFTLPEPPVVVNGMDRDPI